MRKSERYGLNLVEGSDIVNPLVQDVPNYEIIDEELGKNADSSVPLATELLSGTVHALTRENPNASMFRFVATANYKSGDTFTVDGVQVTALLTTGEPLATGCYVINSNVLCCLVGTVLTMFCANSLAEIRAVDSDKLGGKDASYYASDEQVVEAINLAQSANEISLNNANAIANFDSKFNYDTEEVVIGKWYDGRPVCRRTLLFQLDSTWKETTTPELKIFGNSLPDNVTITDVNGIIGGYTLPHIVNQQPATYFEYVGPSKISVRNKTNWNGYILIVNITYIKAV